MHTIRTTLCAATIAIAAMATATPAAQAAAADGARLGSSQDALGWSAAIRYPSAGSSSASLVLVPPGGGVVTVGRMPTGDAHDVIDADPQRQLVLTATTSGYDVTYRIWDLAAGTSRTVPNLPDMEGRVVGFGGAGLVDETTDDAGRTVWESRTLTGALVTSHPLVAGVGQAATALSPDGSRVYETSSTRLYELNLRTGVRRSTALPSVPGVAPADRDCSYAGDWDRGSVQLNCKGTTYGKGISYHLDRAGGRARALTGQDQPWALPTSPVMSGTGLRLSNEYDHSTLWTRSGGAWTEVKGGNSVEATGAVGRYAYALNSDPAGGSAQGWLARYDTSTGKRTLLAGAGSSSGGVITDAVTVDGHR